MGDKNGPKDTVRPLMGGETRGIQCDLPVPTEVFAGRLAEAEADLFKGVERSFSTPADRKEDGNAGAPEPKKTEAEQGIAL